MNQFNRIRECLVYTVASSILVLLVGCSRPSRDNDNFLSRVPKELQEHYGYIDSYRTMSPDKLDSVLNLFDNIYQKDSSSIESAYYNLAIAYGEYAKGQYKSALTQLLRADNAMILKEFPALSAEVKLLTGLAYMNLELNKFAELNFEEAYDYFKTGDYPNQTMLAAFNLAWIYQSDLESKSSKDVDRYVKQCDSIFTNCHKDIKYANYFYYKYIVDQSNIGYIDSILTHIDIAEEPSVNISRLYQMNIGLVMNLNTDREFNKARIILDRLDSISTIAGDEIPQKLKCYYLFEESLTLAKEGHYIEALESYEEGVELREYVSDIRVDVNRYRSLYHIYYTMGDSARSDSAWVCHKRAYNEMLNKQSDDGITSMLGYRAFTERRNSRIDASNRSNLYIQFILILIGFGIVGYTISIYRAERKRKRIVLLENDLEELDRNIDEYIDLME